MSEPKIFFVVGHSNWGKSRTLRALTGETHRVRRTEIAGVEYFIRRMSNDDQPEGFIKRMVAMEPNRWPYILAALCPDFDDPTKATASVLQGLCDRGYTLFFWVLAQQHRTGERISPSEISRCGLSAMSKFSRSRLKPQYGRKSSGRISGPLARSKQSLKPTRVSKTVYDPRPR